ncbi:MAG: 50S ribosomal protein L20 [Firmicutes bacterium]|nr:50S ribosomal protein L20 [Bacillota bacterium]
MSRVKGGTVTRQRHKKTLKFAKGYYGSKSKLYRPANEQVLKSMAYAYRDRRVKKRNFRRLWITRINAAARNNGMSYSRFISGLKANGVEINRKMLADLAVNDAEAFSELVTVAKQVKQA